MTEQEIKLMKEGIWVSGVVHDDFKSTNKIIIPTSTTLFKLYQGPVWTRTLSYIIYKIKRSMK